MRALDDITEAIIDAAIQIHRDLGPGLLESVYEAVLARAREKRGFRLPPSASPRLRVNQVALPRPSRAESPFAKPLMASRT
jgi:GxxExxY protein